MVIHHDPFLPFDSKFISEYERTWMILGCNLLKSDDNSDLISHEGRIVGEEE